MAINFQSVAARIITSILLELEVGNTTNRRQEKL